MKITKTKLKNIILEIINTSHLKNETTRDHLKPDGTFNYGIFDVGYDKEELKPSPKAIEIDKRYEELKKRENFRPWTEEEGNSVMVDDGYKKVVPLKVAWSYPRYSPMMTQAKLIAMKMKVRQRTTKDNNWPRYTLPDPLET